MAKRIQMSRQRPWRAENLDAVIVDRRTKYGNPFSIGHTYGVVDATGVIVDFRKRRDVYIRDAATAVARYAEWMSGHILIVGFYHRPAPSAMEAIRGRDLACWCPLDQPCHADVLLEIANGEHR